MENNWIRFIITPSSSFFPIFQQVIKQIDKDKNEAIVKVVNRIRSEHLKKECHDMFKFVFDWQSTEIVGIEVFRQVREE